MSLSVSSSSEIARQQAVQPHHYQTVIDLFDDTFFKTYQTRLVKGDDEPVYLPANNQVAYHRIVFAHGFFASALHEIAHWCVAGKARRLLEDFGYWYCPDGRDAQQQNDFESVEVKPQALEWCFSMAAGFPFQVSIDNLSGGSSDRLVFQQRILAQVQTYLRDGLPERADRFVAALHSTYNTPTLQATQFFWQNDLID